MGLVYDPEQRVVLVPTKIVTLKVRLGDGEHVNPGIHLFQEGGKIRAGVKGN
jgi:hypothetical protein